jgi:hypothetical protein
MQYLQEARYVGTLVFESQGLKKPAGIRVKDSFFTGFSGKTGFLVVNFHDWRSKSDIMQQKSMQPPLHLLRMSYFRGLNDKNIGITRKKVSEI